MLRKMSLILMIITLAVAGFAPLWAAEVGDVINSIKSQEQAENPESAQIIQHLLDAESQGLPVRSLLNKVREGLAKKVDYWRINEALSRKEEFLRQAKYIIEEAQSAKVVVSTPEQAIEDLAKLLENKEVSETLIREACSLPESAGVDFANLLDICSRVEFMAVTDEQIKKELLVLSLEKQLDRSSMKEIAHELETATQQGEDGQAVLTKVRRRSK